MQCSRSLRPVSAILPSSRFTHRATQRTFVSNPFSSPQNLSASRTIQAPPSLVYRIISDVASYSEFVPYCQSSVVTKTSRPAAADGKTYPEEARLVVGFNDTVSETFWSRVYCVPGRIVEAVSGDTDTSLSADEITHHSARPEASQDPVREGKVLSRLSTKWTLRPFHYKPPPDTALRADKTHVNHQETSEIPGQEKTEVHLNIEYQFTNPMYAALSQAAAPMVAQKMIEAFEKRVRAVMEGPGYVDRK